MKVIAYYLPQFHEIPENNEWWGEGFTEWVNVKKAKPLFDGHNQPRVPLNSKYYNLLDADTKKWQVDLANEYGVYGFCFYHYWFDGKLLLQKPVEQFLQDKALNTHFCICWANEHWTNAWTTKEATVLIEQRYGERAEWEEHFNYLLPYFKDERYIKNDNKPLFVLYRPELIDCLAEMLECWNDLARKNGFSGIDFAYQHVSYAVSPKCDESLFSYALEYHPSHVQTMMDMQHNRKLKQIKKEIVLFAENKLGINLREKLRSKNEVRRFDYDETWQDILAMKPRNEKCVPGAFVDWDNTPRREMRGTVFSGATPEKFERYLTKQIIRARDDYKKDMLFVFSWNEWAEGGYLEPDEKNGYGYLEAIRNALKATGEWE